MCFEMRVMCFDMRKTLRSRASYGAAGSVYLPNTGARIYLSAASSPWLALEAPEIPRSERSKALVFWMCCSIPCSNPVVGARFGLRR
jgi:hypothetical protein